MAGLERCLLERAHSHRDRSKKPVGIPRRRPDNDGALADQRVAGLIAVSSYPTPVSISFSANTCSRAWA
jgi:hypothetical protein